MFEYLNFNLLACGKLLSNLGGSGFLKENTLSLFCSLVVLFCICCYSFTKFPLGVQIVEEMKYLKSATTDRARQVHELHLRMDENAVSDASLKKAFEDEIQSNLNSILAYDDRRRVSFHLAYDEEEQIIFVSLSSESPV